MPLTATRRELEDPVLCEISHTQLSTARSLSYVEVKNAVGLNTEEGLAEVEEGKPNMITTYHTPSLYANIVIRGLTPINML